MHHVRRIRSRPIVGKGLALSAQHMVRHGKARANALHACEFARGWRVSGRFLPEGASPFPTGKRLRIRLMLWKTWVSLRGALGSARPTGLMRIRPTWCFGFVLLRGTPGTAFPTERLRIRRAFIENPPLLRGRRDAAPYKVSACFPPFPSPSGGRWHPPIPREADDGRGRT